MSFSVSNIENLRYIYCNSKIDNSKASKLDSKYEKFASTILNQLGKFFDCRNWINYSLEDHRTPEIIFNLFQVSNSDRPELAHFLASLSLQLAHRFRHEISLMDDSSCDNLAYKHSQQIIKCFEEFTNTSHPKEELKTMKCNVAALKEDLTTLILRSIDPDPKEEIVNRINDYIEERKNRFFRSNNFSRETFFREFIKELNGNDDPRILIDKISRCVLFRDDVLFWREAESLSKKNAQLSLKNKFIQTSETKKDKKSPKQNAKIYTFNNPFFTAFNVHHIPMHEVTENVLLLLFRRSITLATEGNKSITELSTKLMIDYNASLTHKINFKIQELFTNLQDLRNRLIAKKQEESRRQEYDRFEWGGGGA